MQASSVRYQLMLQVATGRCYRMNLKQTHWSIRQFRVVFLVILFASRTSSSAMESSMKAFKLVPEVIEKAPGDALEVKYGEGLIVDKGNELTPTQVRNEPTEIIWPAEVNCYYTLSMAGVHFFPPPPDATPTAEPSIKEVLHWLVVNIPGNDISKGEVLTQYIGSGAPKGIGLQRYVFFVYKQTGVQTFDEPRVSNRSTEGRMGFSNRKFAAKYSLGEPVAGNFFLLSTAIMCLNCKLSYQEIKSKFTVPRILFACTIVKDLINN